MAAAGEAPVVWWAVQEGTEAQLAHLQVASSTWAKAEVCRERALGTATAIVPWHAGAHFRDLPSLSMLLWSSCCPRICRDCSVNTSGLWGLATGNQFFALKTNWVVLGFLCTLMWSLERSRA